MLWTILLHKVQCALMTLIVFSSLFLVCWLYSATAYSPIMSYSWNIRYFYSVYWGIDTISTISYGDIAPNNPIETIYEIATFGFSFVTYGYIVNNIIQVIISARNSKDNFRSELIVYTTYMDTL